MNTNKATSRDRRPSGVRHIPSSQPNPEARYATIDNSCSVLGLNRTRLYAELAAGNLKAVKVGRRTLIDLPAAIEWLEGRPRATFGGGGCK